MKNFLIIFLIFISSTVCLDASPKFGTEEYTRDEIDTFLSAINYAFVTSNDVLTDVTGTELETLTDSSDAGALHTHNISGDLRYLNLDGEGTNVTNGTFDLTTTGIVTAEPFVGTSLNLTGPTPSAGVEAVDVLVVAGGIGNGSRGSDISVNAGEGGDALGGEAGFEAGFVSLFTKPGGTGPGGNARGGFFEIYTDSIDTTDPALFGDLSFQKKGGNIYFGGSFNLQAGAAASSSVQNLFFMGSGAVAAKRSLQVRWGTEVGVDGDNFNYVNTNNQFVFDRSAQASNTDTGNAWIDFADGSASFATTSFTIAADGETVIGAGLTVEGVHNKTIIDVTDTEALLVRKDADGGDVFVVDTTNDKITITGGIALNHTVPNITINNALFNTIMGTDAGLGISTDETNNTLIGYHAGMNLSNTAGSEGQNNLFIGGNAGEGATGGSDNTGTKNVGLGRAALNKITSGTNNVAVGDSALFGVTSGIQNIGVGTNSMVLLSTGDKNIALGFGALGLNTDGDNNIALGISALGAVATSKESVGIGSGSGRSSTGEKNVYIGNNCGFRQVAGVRNVNVGTDAGFGVSGQSYSHNTLIGFSAGFELSTGSDNIFIGYNAAHSQTTLSNLLIIDNQDRGSVAAEITDCLIYGVFNSTVANQSLRINGVILGSVGAKIGDGTNETQISSTGDIVFVGTAGLVYGGISAVENTDVTEIDASLTKYQVTVFNRNMPSNNITPDNTENHILITVAGDYHIVVSATVNSIGGPGSVLELEVMKNNGASRLGDLHADRTLGGGGTERGSIGLSDIVALAVDDTVELWIENETNTQNYVVEDVTMQVIQLGG